MLSKQEQEEELKKYEIFEKKAGMAGIEGNIEGAYQEIIDLNESIRNLRAEKRVLGLLFLLSMAVNFCLLFFLH